MKDEGKTRREHKSTEIEHVEKYYWMLSFEANMRNICIFTLDCGIATHSGPEKVVDFRF